jgi:hypothetical protein
MIVFFPLEKDLQIRLLRAWRKVTRYLGYYHVFFAEVPLDLQSDQFAGSQHKLL